MIEYNTQRPGMALKEYGRNIHNMVKNLLEVEDKESRNEQAKNLVELMKQFIQPGLKENIDLAHKVWDDLFIISNFKLEVDSPFPKPDESVLTKRPDPIEYSYSHPVYRHYGKNIELLILQICALENEQEKDNAIIYIGRLMKNFYSQYNKEFVEDEVIKEQLERLSKGQIVLDLERIKNENLFDSIMPKERRPNVEPRLGKPDRNRRNNNGKNNNLNNQKRRRK